MADPRDEDERRVPLVVIVGYWLMIAVSFLVGLTLVVGATRAVFEGDSNWTFLGVQWAADTDALTIAVYLAVGFAMIAWALSLVAELFDVSLLGRHADRNEPAPEPARQPVIWRAEGAFGHARVAGEELLRIADAYAVAFTAERALATVGAGGLHLWNLASAEELVHVPDVSGHVAVSRDGRHLATTHKDFGIVLRSLRDGEEHWSVVHRGSASKSGFGGVSALAFSADGRRLASGGDPDTRVCSVADGSELLRIATGPTEFYGLIIDFSPDGLLLATTLTDRSVSVWDSSDGHRVRRLDHPHRYGRVATGVAFSPDSSRLATLCADHAICVWEVASGNRLLELPPPRSSPPYFSPRQIAWSPDARCLFAPGSDGAVRGWDISSGHEVFRLQHADPTNRSRATAWSAVDDAILGTASSAATATTVSPDGTLLATAGSETVGVWALAGKRDCT